MYETKIPKLYNCGISLIMEIIGGKWKAALILAISRGTHRPSDLQRYLTQASRRVLNLQLRELENHGIIRRIIYAEIPLKVEYVLTDLGQSLLPVLQQMDSWGFNNREQCLEVIRKEGPVPAAEHWCS
ncbi:MULTISPECIES: helix-turn-helix domain-containing protein [unclassified Siphonobacter]|uniref:winged helix-turn-helix transcriptional regulator n=1 Tax=unclassified Siphonobacter TaxID=2635712 RepID=UPI0027882D45|nr:MULTISPECIES: helix-turn-helix domain-containing protein [unclassified Siphonobacter]MDQ1086711.1 DNA-binding HxlR family transcriptional regulator [Siphonobacter sp. SORGH_AS_1065]MDR6196973.1 DNA-binding HxlR family transcriptional regulator [Siphonobacter sp. SORGH_AS_0500]